MEWTWVEFGRFMIAMGYLFAVIIAVGFAMVAGWFGLVETIIYIGRSIKRP